MFTISFKHSEFDWIKSAHYILQRTLEREARGCQKLVIWTDGDREGENIGFEIIDVCKAGIYTL